MPDAPAPQPDLPDPAQPAASNGGSKSLWSGWHTMSLVAIVIAIVALGVATPSLHLSKLAAWLVTLGLFVVFLVIVGQGVTGRLSGALIDERNKMSLSRFQMVLWTMVLLSGLLTIALSNIGAGATSPLTIDVPSQLWLLMGISTTSLIGSPLLKSNKMQQGKIDMHGDLGDAQFAELFRGEENINHDQLDLAKVQMFFFTLVLVLSYAVLLGSVFSSSQGPISALPPVDQSMIALLGISHAGYLANKAIPRPDAPPEG